MLISGEAGVGKTRLVQEFIAPLQWQGVRILQGRCYEFEGVLPYQPVAEALKSLPPALAAGVAAELPGWVSTQVARLAPDLFAVTPKDAEREAGGEQTQLFEGVVSLSGRVGHPGADPACFRGSALGHGLHTATATLSGPASDRPTPADRRHAAT